MAHALLKKLFRHMHDLAGAATPSDAGLLDDYVSRGDQKAFELLVWRHGEMVLQTCRRILRCSHDAEDAFQAAFWILAQKAGTIRCREALPAWLHRITVRVALAAKERRGRFESLDDVAEPASPSTPPEPMLDLLDEEINRLPTKFRQAIVLCHLQQKSGAEAARELRIAPGTLSSRLTRGRERLRVRLGRRAKLLGGASILLEPTLQAGPHSSAPLIEETVTSALAFAAMPGAKLPANVIVLAKGVLHAMWMRKLAVLAASMLVSMSLGAVAWLAMQPAAAQDKGPSVILKKAVEPDRIAKLVKDRFESAVKTYQAVKEEFIAGRITTRDRLYEWSLKVLEAEKELKPSQNLKALISHLERMRTVHETAKLKFDVGQLGQSDYGIFEHGLLEAELWVEREKAKK